MGPSSGQAAHERIAGDDGRGGGTGRSDRRPKQQVSNISFWAAHPREFSVNLFLATTSPAVSCHVPPENRIFLQESGIFLQESGILQVFLNLWVCGPPFTKTTEITKTTKTTRTARNTELSAGSRKPRK